MTSPNAGFRRRTNGLKQIGGAAGVDEQSIEVFEADLQSNLYKLWNRMSSGSYFPPPIKRVQIDKRDGGNRPLGIPTVSDRVAQAVVKGYLEPDLGKHFHPDSFGYRPGKSALDAVGVARQRCWRHPFVLDLDIRAYFDSISHELLLRAIRKHTDCAWVLLYIEWWLKAPVQLEDGTPDPPREGYAAGLGGITADGESLSSLCVRHVDAKKSSEHPVRALCR